jgi:hypothetical protein
MQLRQSSKLTLLWVLPSLIYAPDLKLTSMSAFGRDADITI